MGMQTVREELENISFQVLKPDAYDTIVERLSRLRDESGDILSDIETELTAKLEQQGIKAQVTGREKRPYSIWRKMEHKHLSLSQLSDIFGFRVIVDEIDDCYQALGIAHQCWRAVPGKFKDYISNPKQNDYRSLHTIVIGPHRMRVEMQIRTWQMHQVAERGIAAHGLYKDAGTAEESESGVVTPATETNVYRWLRRLLDLLAEGDSPKEFLEHTKLELFHDQVFCFTPNGDLIALPNGANAIDFAYAVHTDIGNSCVGCRINGRHAPLMTELHNGDEVEIIRSKAQVPPAAWEGLAVTGKARAAIRRANRLAVRSQYAGLGQEILERALSRHGAEYSEKKFAQALPRLGVDAPEDALAAIGRGEMASSDVLKALGIESEISTTPDNGGKTAKKTKARKKKKTIAVRGVSRDLPISIFAGTGAVPGERIVGILTPGEGIMVFPIFARRLQAFEDEPDRWVDLAWDEVEEDERYPARLKILIHNEVGALAQVAQTIGANEGNIENLQMVTRAADFYDLDVSIEVQDVRHLNQIIQALNAQSLVSSVSRANE